MPHTPLKIAFRRPWPSTHRGLILFEYAMAFILIGGVNYLGTAIPSQTRQYLAVALYFTDGAAEPYGWTFIAVGLFAAVTSYCHFHRDRWGYLAASMWAGAWALVYVNSFLWFDAPVRALGSGLIWAHFCIVLMTSSRLPRLPFDFAKRSPASRRATLSEMRDERGHHAD